MEQNRNTPNQTANTAMEIQNYTTLKKTFAMKAIQDRFAQTLNRNPGSFITSILVAVQQNPDLQKCDVMSIITAGLQAATLDLSVSPSLGLAAITPFRSKGRYVAVFQVMKNGLRQLALRTNKYRNLNTSPIYEGEDWHINRITGALELGGGKQSNKIIAWLGYFKLNNGFEQYLIMTVDEILAHAQRYSKSWNKEEGKFIPGSMWEKDFNKMAEKTILKMLLINHGVLSTGMENAMNFDDSPDGVIDLSFETKETEGTQGTQGTQGTDETRETEETKETKETEGTPISQLSEDEILSQLGFPL